MNISLPGAMPLVIGCTFTNNISASINSFGSANPTIVNCLFYGNQNVSIVLLTDATVSNCTLVDNEALVCGAIKCGTGDSPYITNCIVRGNEPGQIWGGSPVVTYCNVEGGYAGQGNIDDDPSFVDPDNHDYQIASGSSCIDAGSNFGLPAGIDTDMAGNPRFVDDPFTTDTGLGDPPLVDMGSYEYQPGSACPWDVNGNELVDIDDLFGVLAHWGEGPGIYDVDNDGQVDINDVFAILANWGPCP